MNVDKIITNKQEKYNELLEINYQLWEWLVNRIMSNNILNVYSYKQINTILSSSRLSGGIMPLFINKSGNKFLSGNQVNNSNKYVAWYLLLINMYIYNKYDIISYVWNIVDYNKYVRFIYKIIRVFKK